MYLLLGAAGFQIMYLLLGAAGFQLIPRQAVPAKPRRPDYLSDLADQLIRSVEPPRSGGQPRFHRCGHIPAGGLAVGPPPSGHLAQSVLDSAPLRPLAPDLQRLSPWSVGPGGPITRTR